MKYFRLFILLILVFVVTNCEKKDQPVITPSDVQIVGFVLEKCYCCWGWEIKIGADTIKTVNIPDLTYSNDIVFPINGEITLGAKTIDCSGKTDYFEVKSFTQLK
jgi:hypothetical protein